MPIRTDVSEDPKGDPSKIIPQQPIPRTGPPETEPLFPEPDGPVSDPRVKPNAETTGDRHGRTERTPAPRR
ncbi:MAG TPA: hypothetical protein VGF45_15965 [Polyangia bacterium]